MAYFEPLHLLRNLVNKKQKKVRNWLMGPVCGSKFYLCKLYGPPATPVRRSAARRRNCLQIGNHFIAPQQGTNFQGALQLEHPILLK